MFAYNQLLSFFKKPVQGKTSFGLEIFVAVLVKFLLLWGLWWLFFAGHKQPVDGVIIADKLFGEHHPALTSTPNKGH
jgi:hypothetical protein|uniref:cytochrome oxidase putative small subunit CydP n=1 Tax=Crenothrix polyspora TaxID=360316 RepID=UPI000B35C3B5